MFAQEIALPALRSMIARRPGGTGEFVRARVFNLTVREAGLRTVANVIHVHPTQAEAVKQAANAYTRTRLSHFLAWLLRN